MFSHSKLVKVKYKSESHKNVYSEIWGETWIGLIVCLKKELL